MKKILYITDYSDLKRFSDKNRLYRFNAIKLNENFECRDIHNLQDINIKDYHSVCISHETCPVHSRCSNKDIQTLIDQFKTKFIILDDFQRIMKHKTFLYKHYSDIIVTVGGHYYSTLQKEFRGQLHMLPHHIDISIIKDYQLPKQYDILLYGTINEAYPFRQKLYKLLKNNTKFNVKIISKEQNIYGQDISKAINQAWLTVSTKSKYDYLVCKYFEIAGSKSVVLGNMDDVGVQIWNDNFIDINENMSSDEILSIIQEALNDKQRLLDMSDKMYQTITNEYSTTEYAIKLNNIIRNK